MAYIDSDYIKVFPSAERGVEYPESRITTEASFVSIINKLINYDGFVITDEFDEDDPFEFNIHGYYFYITKGSYLLSALSIDSSSLEIYAGITLTTVGDNEELSGVDNDDLYEGVTFNVGSAPSGCDYSLLLLSRESSSDDWEIDDDSHVRFNQTSLNLVVDGTEI